MSARDTDEVKWLQVVGQIDLHSNQFMNIGRCPSCDSLHIYVHDNQDQVMMATALNDLEVVRMIQILAGSLADRVK